MDETRRDVRQITSWIRASNILSKVRYRRNVRAPTEGRERMEGTVRLVKVQQDFEQRKLITGERVIKLKGSRGDVVDAIKRNF